MRALNPALLQSAGNLFDRRPADFWARPNPNKIGGAGARQFTAANSERFALTSDPDPTTQDFWVSVWVYCDTTTAVMHIIATGNASNGDDGFKVSVNADNTVQFGLCDSVQATNASANTTGTLTDTTWHHLLVTFDRDGVATCYVDGTADATTLDISSHTATLGTTGTSQIGASTTPDLFLNGRLARLAYGEGTLPTAAEIAELYNDGAGKTFGQLSGALAAKVVHYWNMHEASSDALDAAGSNDGTDTNTVTAAAGPLAPFAHDVSGNDNHLTLTSFDNDVAPWVNDQGGGQAITQVGDGYLKGAKLAELALANDWSVSLWIKSTSRSNHILGHATSSTNRVGLYFASSKVRFATYNGAYKNVDSDAVLATGVWKHVLATCSNNTLALYIDNVAQTTTGTSGSLAANEQLIMMAKADESADLPEGNTIDDVRIFDSVVSAADRALLYARDTTTATPIANYPLDDGPVSATPSDGDPVAQLQLRSSGREVFYQNTAAWRPIYTAAAVNGRPGLAYDNTTTQHLLYDAPILSGTKGTLFLALQVASDLASHGIAISQSERSGAIEYIFFSADAAEKLSITQNNNDTAMTLTDDTLTIGQTFVVSVTSNGSTISARVNGSAKTLNADAGSNDGDWFGDTDNCNATTLGAVMINTAAMLGFDGYLLDVIAYDDVDLTAEEIAEAEGILASRYGVTLS